MTDSDSDNESRGLNFDALPIQNTVPPNIFETQQSGVLPVRVMNFKYPCLICHRPCTKNQNSICCSICDEWVHQTCSNLTYNQFKTYCSPEHADDLYECENCRLGEASSQYLGKLPCQSINQSNCIYSQGYMNNTGTK